MFPVYNNNKEIIKKKKNNKGLEISELSSENITRYAIYNKEC